MSTDQEYWDACLIRGWRNFYSLSQTYNIFHSITGKLPWKIEPRMKRFPRSAIPGGVGVRVYMSSYLPKINDRLLAQDPEKDVALLKKLSTSDYDTVEVRIHDRELEREKQMLYTNRKRVGMNTLNASVRNRDTDWSVVKGNVRKKASR